MLGGSRVIRHQDLEYLAIIIFALGGSWVIRHQDFDILAIIIFAPGGSGVIRHQDLDNLAIIQACMLMDSGFIIINEILPSLSRFIETVDVSTAL